MENVQGLYCNEGRNDLIGIIDAFIFSRHLDNIESNKISLPTQYYIE